VDRALGEVEWRHPGEVCVLLWDGESVGGVVGVLGPSRENTPIRMSVSILVPGDSSPSELINSALAAHANAPMNSFRGLSGGDRGRAVATPWARPQPPQVKVKASWTDVYAWAGITAPELLHIIDSRAGARGRGGAGWGVPPSKMCVSVVR
ncbi:unnamed protein product, partial [Discosporangium mesarthrocarpum]